MSQCDASPFKKGGIYIIKESYLELGHSFEKGQTVTFVERTYDPHSGVSRYWFKLSEDESLNAWHVWDDDEPRIDTWRKIFEER
jgi:hypothetical protein